MWMRTAVNWDVGRVNGATQAFYRVHATNMHVTTYAGWLTDLEERRKALEVIFDERAHGVPWAQDLRPAAQRALAMEALRRGLAAHRDGSGGPSLETHREFAARIDPTVRETLLWRWSGSTLVGERRIPGAKPRRAVDRARDHVEWRRRRRFGT
jgi:hypothetical protein